ncbi:rab GTPase-binding effector protein 1 isoform X2 [Anabrus simplex]|uniref:rab GTPase-binding effector protein 1 isoform X2 n=1 Tax=Anabrus simplex TaxID=316456 RepID=UPI0034DD8AFA
MENQIVGGDSSSVKSTTEDEDLAAKVTKLLERIQVLEGEKQQSREEFGIQRAKMKEMYLQKEEELKRQAAEHSRLVEEMKKLNAELDESKSQLLVAGLHMESEREVERKCHEEIATLQQLVQESFEESSTSRSKYENEVKHLRHVTQRLEAENQELRIQLHQNAFEKGERDSPILAPGVMLSNVTKNLARKVVSQLGADPSSGSQDNLEDNMRKAKEDAEVLRSLVLPLEEEIKALKTKLRAAYEQLNSQGDKDDRITRPTEEVGDNLPSTGASGQNTEGVSPNRLPVHVKTLKNETSSNVDSDNQQAEYQCASTNSPKASSSVNITAPASTPVEQLCKSSSESQSPLHEEQPKVSEAAHESEGDSRKAHQCDMCSNYEAQLVKAQQQARELENKTAAQERNLTRYREDLAKESEFRKEMEEKWNEKKEEHKLQVAELKEKMEKAEEVLNELRQTYSQTIAEVSLQLARLSHDREKVDRELTRLQKENDNLLGKHSAHSQQLQNESINLPDKVEDLHELLLKFHEELIAAKVAKEIAEEQEKTLRCEIQLMRDQMSVEQQGRESMEDNLTAELLGLKKQLSAYERDRHASQKKFEEMDQTIKNNKHVNTELKEQLTELQKAKSQLEATVSELRSRVGSLQQELDNAETVQQDFVRLSQSLQVQLEKIRDSDSQVRWQHEEDVEECPVCRNNFSVTRRKTLWANLLYPLFVVCGDEWT